MSYKRPSKGRRSRATSCGITGEEAVFAFYEACQALAAELFALHTGPKLWIEDPQEDWEVALGRIHAALGG